MSYVPIWYCVTIWTTGSTAKVAKKMDTKKLTTTTTSATGPSPVATLKQGSTVPSGRDVKRVGVVLTQAGPRVGTSDQSTIDQMINAIVDNNVLSMSGIAQFLLSPPHERSIMLMQAVNKMNEKSGELQIDMCIHMYLGIVSTLHCHLVSTICNL